MRTATQSCSPAAYLHLFFTPLFLCGPLELSVCGQQSRFYSRYCFPNCNILGLTETWIIPEDSATPAALSHNLSFSHTPRQVRKGGGTGLLISNNWKYSILLGISCYHCNCSGKTPCCSHLSPSWAIGHLPRRAGWPIVLIPRGWQPTYILW